MSAQVRGVMQERTDMLNANWKVGAFLSGLTDFGQRESRQDCFDCSALSEHSMLAEVPIRQPNCRLGNL